MGDLFNGVLLGKEVHKSSFVLESISHNMLYADLDRKFTWEF